MKNFKELKGGEKSHLSSLGELEYHMRLTRDSGILSSLSCDRVTDGLVEVERVLLLFVKDLYSEWL
jgi:hypothetical protein